MLPVALSLIGLAVSWVAGVVALNRHGNAVSCAVSACGDYGGQTADSPDPFNSRLVARCRDSACGGVSHHLVRASALSLFGVTVLFLALLAGVAGGSRRVPRPSAVAGARVGVAFRFDG